MALSIFVAIDRILRSWLKLESSLMPPEGWSSAKGLMTFFLLGLLNPLGDVPVHPGAEFC